MSCEFISTKGKNVQQHWIQDSVIFVTDTLDQKLSDSAKQKALKTKAEFLQDTIKAKVFNTDSIGTWKKKFINDSLRKELDKYPKHIYLTFDDGPLIGSKAIDSIARLKNIKINTFLVGKHANMSKRLKEDYLIYYNNPLVECYNHSYSHANNKYSNFYSKPTLAFEDFTKNEEFLNLQYKIARLPGRNIWLFDDVKNIDLKSGASTAEMLYKDGYKVFGWDLEWRINGATGVPDQTVEHLFKRIKNYMNNKSSLFPNNVVLLMHDDMFRNHKGQQLLVALIDSLQQNTDYSFEHMRAYPYRY